MPTDAYNFSYSWRWTQPTHNVFPPDVMAQIKPLEHAPAPKGLLDDRYGIVAVYNQLDPLVYDDVQTASANVSTEDGIVWLRALPVELNAQVVVRWDSDSVAVRTTWEVFTRYWDDFCYPVSDDVQVFPHTGEWLLLYHNYEQFEWGRKK